MPSKTGLSDGAIRHELAFMRKHLLVEYNRDPDLIVREVRMMFTKALRKAMADSDLDAVELAYASGSKHRHIVSMMRGQLLDLRMLVWLFAIMGKKLDIRLLADTTERKDPKKVAAQKRDTAGKIRERKKTDREWALKYREREVMRSSGRRLGVDDDGTGGSRGGGVGPGDAKIDLDLRRRDDAHDQ